MERQFIASGAEYTEILLMKCFTMENKGNYSLAKEKVSTFTRQIISTWSLIATEFSHKGKGYGSGVFSVDGLSFLHVQ